jgi:hypothetical protein
MPIVAMGLSGDRDHRGALQSSSPANCRERTVTTSDFANVSMQSCLMGARDRRVRIIRPSAWRQGAV